MKKLFLLLTVVILSLCAACSNGTVSTSTLPSNTGNDVQVATKEEAKGLLQSWLNDNPFNEPVTIRDGATPEDDSGYNFVLYQTEALASVRVVKANGRILHSNPETGNYISIDDWYAGRTPTSTHDDVSLAVSNPVQADSSDIVFMGIPIKTGLSADDVIKALGTPLDRDEYKLYYGDADFHLDYSASEVALIESHSVNLFEVNGVTLNKNRAELVRLLGDPTDDYEFEGGYALSFHLANSYIFFDLGDPNEPAWRIHVYPGGGGNEDDYYEDGISDDYYDESYSVSTRPIDPDLTNGRWVSEDGRRLELFTDGTGTTNLGEDGGMWSTIRYNVSRDGVLWQAQNGRLTLAAQAVFEDAIEITSSGGVDQIRLPSSYNTVTYNRREGGSGVVGVWMEARGGAGFQINSDGTGRSHVFNAWEGEEFTWYENNGVLTRTFTSAYEWDYTVSGNTLTLFGRSGSTIFSRVGGN